MKKALTLFIRLALLNIIISYSTILDHDNINSQYVTNVA